MVESNSKILLDLESDNAALNSTSAFESRLLVCKKDRLTSTAPANPSDKKPTICSPPKSQVLGKVKDFLGIMSESNKKLLQDAKENPENFDIEVLNEKEAGYIEMDLMLGVADLHTPEAVSAAEAAMSGCQPVFSLATDNSSSESEDSSDDDEETEEDDDGCAHAVGNSASPAGKASSDKPSKHEKSRKRQKIVELS